MIAALGPLILPQDPLAQSFIVRLKPPSVAHWFGTDRYGRDVFARVLLGTRWSLLLGLAAPFFIYPVFLMKALCFALFACAFNLLVGYTGLLSFGHAAFLGGGGYMAGHAIKLWGFPTELGLLMGMFAGAVLGFVVGSLAIRRQGIYFAMITLALSQMLYFFCLQAPFTGGEDGLQAVPRGTLLGSISLADDLTLYYVVFAIFIAGFWIIHRTIHSPFGQVLKAIRENEPRAISLGYDVDRFKLLAFVISTALAGLAGATNLGLIDPGQAISVIETRLLWSRYGL